MKPNISHDGIYYSHETCLDLENLNIYLVGHKDYSVGAGTEDTEEAGVEHNMASQFIKNLNLCMSNGGSGKKSNPYLPILIHMKTCGGDVIEGMAIYDAIKTCPNPIIILNYTHARSMSSIIFQAADKRVMILHSYFMFHEGDGFSSGTEKQIRSAHEFYKRYTTFMLDIYSSSMKRKGIYKNKTKSEIRHWLVGQMDKKEDVYLSAVRAVDLGLADEMFDGNWKKLREVK